MIISFLKNQKEVILLIPYLIVGFIPYFGSIDKIAPQFLFLSIYNIILLGFNLYHSSKEGKLGQFFQRPLFYIFGLFTLWSSFSFLYASNKVEVAIELSRLIIYTVATLNISILVHNKKSIFFLNTILVLISIVLFIEIFYVLSTFINRFNYSNYTRDTGLRTFTGNINIAAFSILLKTPIMIFLLYKVRDSFKSRFFSIVILSTIFFTLFLLGSRGANLSLFLIIFISSFYLYFKQKKRVTTLLLIFSLVIASTFNSILLSNSNLKVIDRSLNLDTSSTRQRIDFWTGALSSIQENPIIGIGLGNWKINSIYHYSNKMLEYTVPYHAHSDYLQVAAEVGLIGFFIFYFGLFYLFVIRTKIFKKIVNDKSLIVFFLSASILVVLIDSFLNFPLARPVIYIHFIILLSILLSKVNKVYPLKKYSKLLVNTTIILIFSISIFSSYASYRVFNSFREQNFLIQASRGKITNYSIEQVKLTESRFPNISATTVPLETMKANLLYEKGVKDDTILKMIEKGDKHNPYIHIGDALKAVYYIDKNKKDTTYLDSAYSSIKKAYYGIPNNKFHRDIFYDIIEFKKDTLELSKAYDYLESPSLGATKKYFQVYNKIYDSVSEDKLKLVESKMASFPGDSYLKTLRKTFKVGKQNIEKGIIAALEAKTQFEKENYKEAAIKYEEAFGYNDLEIAYFENAANAYMQIGENNKGIQILEKMLTRLEPTTGKAEYLLGIMYVDLKKYKKGCYYFDKSIEKGFSISNEIIEYFCTLEKLNQSVND